MISCVNIYFKMSQSVSFDNISSMQMRPSCSFQVCPHFVMVMMVMVVIMVMVVMVRMVVMVLAIILSSTEV